MRFADRAYMSRRSPELVLELIHDSLDLPLGAAASISVSPFEQINEVVAPAVDSVDILGTELSPVVVQFASKLLPPGSENV